MKVYRTLGNSDLKYKIITAGKAFSLPCGILVRIMYNGHEYQAKMHETHVGRIDRLTELYSEWPLEVGDTISLEWDGEFTIYIKDEVNADSENQIGDDCMDTSVADTDETVAAHTEDTDASEEELAAIEKAMDEAIEDWFEEINKDKTAEDSHEESVPVDYHTAYFESQNDYDRMAECLADMDTVVEHKEYMRGRASAVQPPLAVNNTYVVSVNENGAVIYSEMMEKLTSVQFKYQPRKGEYLNFVGVNKHGFWFLVHGSTSAWNGEPVYNKLILLNPCVDYVETYDINPKKGTVDALYIDGYTICYISAVTQNKEILYVHSSSESGPVEWCQTRKGQSISTPSIYGEKLAYFFSDESEKDNKEGWYISDMSTGTSQIIASEPDPKKPWMRLIPIHGVDLKNNIIFTGVTSGEAKSFDISEIPPKMDKSEFPSGYELPIYIDSVWAIRRLEKPVEGRILSFKLKNNTSEPALWYGMERYSSGSMFFDGVYHLTCNSCITLVRADRKGQVFYVGDTGHGEADRFMVTANRVIVNYDAFGWVSLPKQFATSKGVAQNNIQAISLKKD